MRMGIAFMSDVIIDLVLTLIAVGLAIATGAVMLLLVLSLT